MTTASNARQGGMAFAPRLATRTMKARRETTCPTCRAPIRVGQPIAKCGGMWMHARCLIGHRHQLDRQETPA